MWGEEDHRMGVPVLGLIVSMFYDSQVANAVFTAPDQILYPVPSDIYRPEPWELVNMSNSQRDKRTTILSQDTHVLVQVDRRTSFVNYMRKGGKGQFALTKEKSDWMMEVDIAVSDEKPCRRVYARSCYFPGALVETINGLDLDKFDPEKAYKGMVKLVLFYDMLDQLATEGLRKFVQSQQQFKETGSSYFTFILNSIYETDDPDISVVYDAPWQTVKRSIVLTPAHYEAPEEEEEQTAPLVEEVNKMHLEQERQDDNDAKKEAEPLLYTWMKATVDGTETEEEKTVRAQLAEHSTDFSIPISSLLLPESIEQIHRTHREQIAQKKAEKAKVYAAK